MYTYALPYVTLFFMLLLSSFPITLGRPLRSSELSKEILLLVLLILFIGFRAFVFSDWINYYVFYEKVPSLWNGFDAVSLFLTQGWYASKERGFLVYAILLKTISSNYFFFQAVSALIDLVMLFFLFKTYIHEKIILGLVFFLLFAGIEIEINLLRNSKAIILFFISIKYIKERKIVPYMVLNVLGILFHTASLFYLPLYFILHKRISKRLILFLYLAGNIIYLAHIKWIKELLMLMSSYMNSRLGFLIKSYVSSDLYSSSYGIGLGYLERTLSFMLVFLWYDTLIKKRSDTIIFINCAMIYWFIYLYCSEMYILLQRIPTLFVFSYWILYPQIYSLLSKQFKYLFLFMLLCYGTLKFAHYNSYFHQYENILVNHLSYSQKKPLVNQALEKSAEKRLGQKNK